MERGGKRGLPVIIGLIHTEHTEANDEDEDYDKKWQEQNLCSVRNTYCINPTIALSVSEISR